MSLARHQTLALIQMTVLLIGSAAESSGPDPQRSSDSAPTFPISYYVEHGVPDPRWAWSAAEYEQALEALQKLPRTQLPRTRSPSQQLFDRLVASYRRALDLPLGGLPSGMSEAMPLSLPKLYSEEGPDGLLFDEELVIIRGAVLDRSLNMLPTIASLDRAQESIAPEKSEKGNDRSRFQKLQMRARLLATETSRLVRNQTLDLIKLAGDPDLTDRARNLLGQRIQEMIPRTDAFLLEKDSHAILDALREVAA